MEENDKLNSEAEAVIENAITDETGKEELSEEEKIKLKKIHRKQELIRTLKYVLFTTSAGAIQIGSSSLFWYVFHFNYWTGYLIALVLSVIWNFTFNRKFTFKSANNVPIAMLKVFGYYCVFTPLSTLWGHALSSIGWNNYAIEIPTMLINGITEFLFCRFVVFGKTINTNKFGKAENEKIETIIHSENEEKDKNIAA